MVEKTLTITKSELNNKSSILHDYHICCLSREISLTIRKEVLTGKAKFGVSDDGKEVFQVALAKTFQKGDFRADYYRGHTLLLALEIATPEQAPSIDGLPGNISNSASVVAGVGRPTEQSRPDTELSGQVTDTHPA